MNIKQICKKYSILEYTDIETLLKEQEPIVTIAMLSYRRPKSLIRALKRHLDNGTPLNLCLRVQGYEELSDRELNKISVLVSQFHGNDLQFTEKNLGSGIPRHDVIHQALTLFDTPYIMTTDDDMMWQPNSIMAQVAVLESLPEYGAIGSVCEPSYPRYYVSDGKVKQEKVLKSFVDTDICGSATCIYRREIFETCEYDKNYQIGWGDADLCMQIKYNGWKIGIMNIPELNSLNDWDPSAKDYIKERYNRPVIKKSRQLFKKKWGISV